MIYKKTTKYNNLWELLEQSSLKNPDAIVYNSINENEIISRSYIDFHLRVRKLANYLYKKGLRKGNYIIVYLENSPFILELLFSCALIGVICVNIDITKKISSVKKIVTTTKAKHAFVQKDNRVDVKTNFYIEDVEKYIASTDPITTREFIKDIDSTQVLEIIFSATNSKAITITHQNILSNLSNFLLVFPQINQSSLLQSIPLSNIYAQLFSLVVMTLGGTIFSTNNYSLNQIQTILKSNSINLFVTSPYVLRKAKLNIESRFKKLHLLQFLRFIQKLVSFTKIKLIKNTFLYPVRKNSIGQVKNIFCLGANLDSDLYKWWDNLGAEVYKIYGTSEAGPILSFDNKHDIDSYSVGNPIPSQMIKIENNELLTKGEHVTEGYFNSKNSSSFTEDGWFKTGDFGYMKDGKIYINGKIKDMISLKNGVVVHPIDIENRLKKMDGIDDCIVINKKTKSKEKLTAVFITKLSNAQIQKIISKINSYFVVSKLIKDFVLWEKTDFPRNVYMDVNREELSKILNKN